MKSAPCWTGSSPALWRRDRPTDAVRRVEQRSHFSGKRRRRRGFPPTPSCGSVLISRILCPRRPSVPGCDHLSVRLNDQPAPARAVVRLLPGAIHPLRDLRPGGPFLLFCLAPHEVCRAPFLAVGAVGSYPAVSPLPLPKRGGLFSVTLSVTAACTAAPTLSRGMLPCGVRTFLWHPVLRRTTSDHSDRPAASLTKADGKGKLGFV